MIVMSDTRDMAPDAAPLTEVAKELGIPEPTLRYWYKQGFIRHWRLRGHWVYVSRSEVIKYNSFTPGSSGPLPPPPDQEP